MKPPALVSWNIRIPFVPVEPEPMFVPFTRSIEAWISKVVLELEESLNWNSPFVPKPWGTKVGVPATLDVRRSMLDVQRFRILIISALQTVCRLHEGSGAQSAKI